MSDIEIHGATPSTCTRRVMYAAALLNQPINLVTVDVMKGQHKTAEYKKYQPFGKVPHPYHQQHNNNNTPYLCLAYEYADTVLLVILLLCMLVLCHVCVCVWVCVCLGVLLDSLFEAR